MILTSAPHSPTDFRFSKRQHLRAPADFKHVYAQRCTARSRTLLIFGALNNLPHTRIGLSVSRKHGNAVVRNLLKRRMREAFRLSQHEIPFGLDLILIPERECLPSVQEFQDSLRRSTRQLAARLAKRS